MGAQAKAKILIVDDERVHRFMLHSLFTEWGWDAEEADDGSTAVAAVAQGPFDAILMDVRMPVCDGLSACRQLQADARTSDIPVIFLSGAVMPDERLEGLLAGAVDYVTKPFNFEEVRIRLSMHLRARRPAAAAPEASEPAPGASNLDSILFQSARQHLLRNLAETPNLECLARLVSTNPKRLNEAFKHCVGATVFTYLREERMRQARALLSDTTREVQTIALELGFTSGANFATAFKERFGVTPLQFRQNRADCPAD